MARIFDKISETTMQWLDALSDRERRLLIILFASLSIVTVVGFLYFSINKIAVKQADLSRNQDQLSQIKDLETSFIEAKNKNEKARRAILRNDISLFTLITSVASSLGLTVKDLSEIKRPLPKSNVVEISVRVNLTKLSIDKVTALIEGLETSNGGNLVKITKLKINKRFDDPSSVDLQLTVSTWKAA